jgi:hypothetical protein
MTDDTTTPDLTEKVALAIAKIVEGPNFDPFSDPEAFDFAQTMAQAAIATLTRELVEARVEAEPSPYCDVCGSCGDQGCGCTHKCKYAFEHPEVFAELDTLRADLTATKARLAEACRIMERLRDFDGWNGTFHAGHALDARDDGKAFLAKQEASNG